MPQQGSTIDLSVPKSERELVTRFGLWLSILAGAAALAAFAIAITTAPARSGPFCLVESCITYPYTDAAAFVPIEYLWMYPAALMAPLFVMVVISVQSLLAPERRPLTRFAAFFGAVSAIVLAVNYFIQFTVVEPSLLKGETEGLSLFSQYNPHGVFIALEDLGFLSLGISFLFAGTAVGSGSAVARAIRVICVVAAVMDIGALVVLGLIFGSELEYRFEVAAILIDWVAMIPIGILFAIFFVQSRRSVDVAESNANA